MESARVPMTIAVALMLAVCLWCGRENADAQDTAQLDTTAAPQFAPVEFRSTDDKNVRQVTTSVGSVRFSMQIPAGYEVINRNSSTLQSSRRTMETLVFGSPKRSDGLPRTQIVIAVTDGFKNITYDMMPAKKLAEAMLGKYPQMFSDYRQSESSAVELDGKQFGTATFEGRKSTFGPNLVHAFVYIGLLGDHTIAIEAYDPGATPKDLDLMHKAARSIKFL